jgi:hypothetical protein
MRAVDSVNFSGPTEQPIPVSMTVVRQLVVGVCGAGYWVWSTVVLGAAFLAWGASEEPPFREEQLLLWPALFSWLFASAVVFGTTLHRGSLPLLGLWAIQATLLVAALLATLDSGGVRVAPPLLVFGVVAQLSGLLAIALRQRSRTPSG